MSEAWLRRSSSTDSPRARERGHDTEIGHVSGREEERARAADEGGELLLQSGVLPPVTADEVRGAAAGAATRRALRHAAASAGCAASPR